MACTYTLTIDGKDQAFASEQTFRDYLLENKGKFDLQDANDIPETFEGQRDQFASRWKLTGTVKEGQFGYITSNAKTPTLALAKRMAKQLQEKSGPLYNKLNIRYDSTYGLIHINPRIETSSWSGESYDIDPEPNKQPRIFQQLDERDFRMAPGDQSRYFLSAKNIGTDTYTHQGEYFNVTKNRTGTAAQLAKNLGTSLEGFSEKIKGSNFRPEMLKDFLEGKTNMKLSLYKVDRITDPELFNNPAEDTSIGTLRKSKVVQRATLQRQIAQEKDPTRRSALYKERNRVISQIKELGKPANQNIAYLKKIFLDDKEAYGGKDFSSISDIDRALRLFDGYGTLFSSLDLKPFGEEIEKEFQEHLRDIAQIRHELQVMKDKQSIEYMSLQTGANLTDSEGNLLPVKDIASFAAVTLAMSTTQNNPLVRYIGQTTNFAVNQAKDKTVDKREAIKSAVKNLREFGKTQGMKGVDVFKYMLEEDTEGKPNGHFVVKYGQFYTNLSHTLKGKDEKQSIGKFLKYLRDNTQGVDTLKDEFKKEWDKIHTSALRKIQERSPEQDEQTTADAAVIEANKIAYGIDPQNFVKILDKFNKEGKVDDKDIAFIKTFIDRGGYYKFMKLSPKDELRDPKFAAIDKLPSDHPQKVFYNLFSELHYEANERVRVEDKATLRRNFIAEYRRDYKGEDESMFDYLKDTAHDWTLNMLTESPRDNIQGLDPLTKEITRAIPFYAFDGRIDPADKNYNLGKVLGVLAEQFYKYEAMAESENDLLTAQYVLKQTPVYETNSFGTPVIINGEPVIKKDTSAMYKQADYHILAILYNERQKKDGVGQNKYYDAKSLERIKEFDDQVKNGTELDSEQAEEYRKLKANYKSITVKKATNSLLHWTSIKNIGFNLFGGLAEIFQGTGSLYLRYGSKEWFKTVFPTLLQLMNPQDSAAKNKLNNLRKTFHIESDVNPNLEESKFKKVAYLPYSIARTMANSGYLIATLKGQMVKDKGGVEHALYDIMDYDEHGKIVLPANFDNPFYNSDGTFSSYKYKLGQIIAKEIKQNRDRETDIDPIQLDQHFWGRLLGQFKASWLFEGFATRFGEQKEGLNDLDTPTKGIYRSFWDLAKSYNHTTNALGETETSFSLPKTLLKAMINVVKFSAPGRIIGWGKQGEEQTLDYEGAVRTVREIQSALFLYGMVLLVGGMAGGDDKDKWRKRGMTYLTNFFMRTQRDMSTYFDPTSLTSIINKNVIPSLGTVNEAIKLLEDPFQGVFGGNWYYNEGKDNEEFRMTRDAADLVPLMNQVRMTINKAEKKQGIFY